MVAKMFAAAFAALVTGCGAMTTEPTVYIDGSIPSGTFENVSAGLDAWEDAGVGVRFTRRVVPHAELVRLVSDKASNTIYISTGTDESHSCLDTYTVDHGALAETFSRPGIGAAVVCTGWGNGESSVLGTTTAIHELGHALGLAHDHPGTVMGAGSKLAADHITGDDKKQFCRVWDTPECIR